METTAAGLAGEAAMAELLGSDGLHQNERFWGEPMGQRDARDQGEKDGQGGAGEYPRGNLFGRVAVVGF